MSLNIHSVRSTTLSSDTVARLLIKQQQRTLHLQRAYYNFVHAWGLTGVVYIDRHECA